VIFGDGTQTRDLVYVGDVARAIVLALETGSEGHVLCNIGGGREISVAELARAALRACGRDEATMTFAPARAGEIARSAAATGRAEEVLGFRAEVELAEGLGRTAAWLSGQAIEPV
jgi:UDP-glucose 4-epimerase